MKTKRYNLFIAGAFAMIIAFGSCVKDLDTIPIDKDEVTSASVYNDTLANYTSVLAKLYAGLAVSGQEGPHGNNDLSGLDEGFGQYLRAYWYAQELPTDEAIISWNDGNLRDYHEQDWSASNEFITNMYYRIYYQVSLCNEFIRETEDAKLDERGLSASDKATIKTYRAEARVLRALSYWHALDLFGNVPFVTEKDKVGSFFPKQISREDLFAYVESELLDVEDDLMAPMTNDYARVDRGVAWMILAKLYLNAEVYTGSARYTDCLTYTNKVIAAGYTLDPDFENLFLADNNTADGIIFPITFDGDFTRTWGGTTFIIHAAVGGSMTPGDFGIDGGWAGLRVTKEFVGKFFDLATLKNKPVRRTSKAAYPVIYVPGDHNSWSHDTTALLASVNSDGNYEGYINMTGGNGFKIDSSDNWTNDWGDNEPDGTLDRPGANIGVPEDGYFKINVNWNTKAYTMVKTTWGIIGDATPGAWNTDTEMTYDPATGEWSIITDLTAGDLKFRANNDWGYNYGDDGADGILEDGGANISIADPGQYEIKLKLGYADYTYSITKFASDGRVVFYSDGQSLEIDDQFEFTEGYAAIKFKNITSTGAAGSHVTFPDTDFPMFRIADAYLMYAEAVLRGGSGGDLATALTYVNMVLTRAYGGDNLGNITAGELNLDFILDERAREFFWEAQRRTDLIRFGQFSNGTYTWAWKGGDKVGIPVDSKFDIYPIPTSDIGANPELTQNPGY